MSKRTIHIVVDRDEIRKKLILSRGSVTYAELDMACARVARDLLNETISKGIVINSADGMWFSEDCVTPYHLRRKSP